MTINGFIYTTTLLMGQVVPWPIVREKIEHPKSVPVLIDIEQHAKSTDKLSNDMLTIGHETLHEAHSNMRNHYRVGAAFYGKNNKGVILRYPKVTLRDISRTIPSEYRDGLYSLYLVQSQQWWNNEPFYILDEFSAYIAGAQVAIEFADKQVKTRNDSLWRAIQFKIYVAHMCQLIDKDKTYDAALLKRYLQYLFDKTDSIYERSQKYVWLKDDKSTALMNKFKTHDSILWVNDYIWSEK